MVFDSDNFSVIMEQAPSQSFLLALSGGLDSQVLLALLNCFVGKNSQRSLRVIHINHGVSPDAEKWARFGQEQCQAYHIPYSIEVIDEDLTENSSGFEAAAREARYQVFKTMLQSNETLITAHHADDQVETMMLQWLRGAGVKGLAAMPLIQSFGEGYLFRPLLSFARSELLLYAQENKISWVEDASNQDEHYARNYLRQAIIPLLKQRWPSIMSTTLRSANHCAVADELLMDLAKIDFESVYCKDGQQLYIDQLMKLSFHRQCNVLRYACLKFNYKLPSEKKLNDVIKSAVYCSEDSNPCVTWSGVELRRYQNKLYFMPPLEPFDSNQVIHWDFDNGRTPVFLDNTIDIDAVNIIVKTYDLCPSELIIAFRQGGERLKHHGAKHSHSLKNCFQDWEVPPWLRDRTPLVMHQKKIIYVSGYWCYGDFL